jgi:hypothetical protein
LGLLTPYLINNAKRMKKLNVLDVIALILVIIGGLNWGLVGLFNYDLVSAIFGVMTVASRVVYVLVGLAALYTIGLSTKISKK